MICCYAFGIEVGTRHEGVLLHLWYKRRRYSYLTWYELCEVSGIKTPVPVGTSDVQAVGLRMQRAIHRKFGWHTYVLSSRSVLRNSLFRALISSHLFASAYAQTPLCLRLIVECLIGAVNQSKCLFR